MNFKRRFTVLLLLPVLIGHSQTLLNWTHFLEQRSKPALGSEPLCVSSSGNVIVPYAHAFPGIDYNIASIVTLRSSDGTQINKYDLPQTLASMGDYPAGFVIDGANNVYTGFTFNYDNSYDLEDSRLFKHNTTLVPQWDRYNYSTMPPGADFSYDLAFSPGSLFWLTQRGDSGMCVSKYTTGGSLIWRKFLNRNPSFIRTDLSGNFYLIGSVFNNSFANDIYLVKYNASGMLQWERFIHAASGAFPDLLGGFTTDTAGNIYVTGSGQRTATGFDIITAKFDWNGVLQWSRLITGSGNHNDFGKAIATDTAGNVFVTGSIYEKNNGVYSDNIIIRKYSSSGSMLATRKYNFKAGVNDVPTDIKISRAGKVYITGKTGVSYLFQQYNNLLAPVEYSDYYTPDTASLVAGVESMEAKGDYIVIKNNKAYVLGEFYFNANCCVHDFYVESFVRKYTLPSTAPRFTIDEQPAISSIKLYPNPVNDVLHFDIHSTIEQLNIYDVAGRTVLHWEKPEKNDLNISSLNSGLYILQIKSPEGVVSKHFVKR